LGNQLPVTGLFGIGSAKRQQTAFVDGTAGPRPRAAVGTSRSCLEPTLARTFSHPTKESETIDFDPGFPYRGCPGALLLNELVGKFLRREASRFHAELGDACPMTLMYGPAVRCKRVSSIWRTCGLASMYPASDWSVLCSEPYGYQRACGLISGPASNGPFGSPVFACAGKTDPPSRITLSKSLNRHKLERK
jgi:hypothetical protein